MMNLLEITIRGKEPRGSISRRLTMALEIERKFLVRDQNFLEGVLGTSYRQGYLLSTPEKSARVRIAGTKGYITIKSGVSPDGFTRSEFEYEIPLDDAEKLLEKLCDPKQIQKTRYKIPFEGNLWEIDVFEGANAGLIVAEVELTSEDQVVTLPPWIGEEVTTDSKYTNGRLAKEPFTLWTKKD